MGHERTLGQFSCVGLVRSCCSREPCRHHQVNKPGPSCCVTRVKGPATSVTLSGSPELPADCKHTREPGLGRQRDSLAEPGPRRGCLLQAREVGALFLARKDGLVLLVRLFGPEPLTPSNFMCLWVSTLFDRLFSKLVASHRLTGERRYLASPSATPRTGPLSVRGPQPASHGSFSASPRSSPGPPDWSRARSQSTIPWYPCMSRHSPNSPASVTRRRRGWVTVGGRADSTAWRTAEGLYGGSGLPERSREDILAQCCTSKGWNTQAITPGLSSGGW